MAQLLGVKLYDRQLLEPIREEHNLTQEDVDQIKAVKPSWWYKNVSQDLYDEEEALVRELAEKESCVILGRTGFHIFRENERAFKVFLRADRAFRLDKVARRLNIDEESADKLIDSSQDNPILKAVVCFCVKWRNLRYIESKYSPSAVLRFLTDTCSLQTDRVADRAIANALGVMIKNGYDKVMYEDVCDYF